MSNFKVSSLPESVSKLIREKLVDGQGHQLAATPAGQGAGPCRSCLKRFVPTDTRILFSYNPDESNNPYNEIGPIFIHEDVCIPYSDPQVFPPEIKNDKKNFPLTLRCYDNERRMVHAELLGERNVEDLIESLFNNSDIEYIHARNAEPGCFIAKIERA